MIDRDHPAVERGLEAHTRHVFFPSQAPASGLERIHDILTAVLPHLTADDLRHTPAGQQLLAEGKSAGWDDALNELRKGQGMQRALAGTINTRKPNYKEITHE